MSNKLEKRYPLDPIWVIPCSMITAWFLYPSPDMPFLAEFLVKYQLPSVLNLIIQMGFSGISLLLTYWISKRLLSWQFSKIYLIIDEQGIHSSKILRSFFLFQSIEWQDTYKVIQQISPSRNITFYVVYKKYIGNYWEHPVFTISTLWKVDDNEELSQFFKKLGYPVEVVHSDGNEKRVEGDIANYGKRSKKLAYTSILFMMIGWILSMADKYSTLDYGNINIWIIRIACVVLVVAGCSFYWLRSQNASVPAKAVLSTIFASTFTIMLIALLLTVSPVFSQKQKIIFRIDKQKQMGNSYYWFSETNKDIGLYCGAHPNKTVIQQTKEVEVLQFLGLLRINRARMCQSI